MQPRVEIIISANSVGADPEKVKAIIIDWPKPKPISVVQSIHGLATFYRFLRVLAPLRLPSLIA